MIRISLFNELCRLVEEGVLDSITNGKLKFPKEFPSLRSLLSNAKLFYFQEDWYDSFRPETDNLNSVFKQWDGLWNKFQLPFPVTAVETPRDVIILADLVSGQTGLSGERLLLVYRKESELIGVVAGGMFENVRWDLTNPAETFLRATRGTPFLVPVNRNKFRPFPTSTIRQMVSAIALGQMMDTGDPFLSPKSTIESLLPSIDKFSTKKTDVFVDLCKKSKKEVVSDPAQKVAETDFLCTSLPYAILKVAYISNPKRFVVERVPPTFQRTKREEKIPRAGERSCYTLLDLKFIRETLKLGQPSEDATTDRAGGPRRAHWRTLMAECYYRGPDGSPRSIEVAAHWVGTRQCLWQGWVYIVRPEI